MCIFHERLFELTQRDTAFTASEKVYADGEELNKKDRNRFFSSQQPFGFPHFPPAVSLLVHGVWFLALSDIFRPIHYMFSFENGLNLLHCIIIIFFFFWFCLFLQGITKMCACL